MRLLFLLTFILSLLAVYATTEHHQPQPIHHQTSTLDEYLPCVWTEDQLIQLAPHKIWNYNEQSESLPYKLCEMKLKHLALYTAAVDGTNVARWYNLSSEYLVFRLNHLLEKEYHYITIPGAHDIVEHGVVDSLRLKCLSGYCDDYHIVMEECGGELYGLEFIYSNFYYLHFSMYSRGILRLQVCNSSITTNTTDWLDNLITRISHADYHEFFTHGHISMRHDEDNDSGRSFYIIIVVIGVLLALLALFTAAFCLVGRRKQYYADPDASVPKSTQPRRIK